MVSTRYICIETRVPDLTRRPSLTQPLRLEVKKMLSSRSDRVKAVDMHPDEPWVLAALYNGHVFIWNYETQSLFKSFEITSTTLTRPGPRYEPPEEIIQSRAIAVL